MLTAVATSVSFVVAILTPPKGGPFCTAGCVAYPYTDIAAYIPRDFLWMYPALLPAPLFVILLIGLQERAPTERKRFGRIAVTFGAMAAATIDQGVEMVGFARKNDDGRNADRRLANRRLQPLGHLTANSKYT